MKAIERLTRASDLLQAQRAALYRCERSPATGEVPASVAEELEQLDQAIAGLAMLAYQLGGLRVDAQLRKTDPEFLRDAVKRTGLSTREVARRIGIDDGALRGYLSGRRLWPYAVQYAIEALAVED